MDTPFNISQLGEEILKLQKQILDTNDKFTVGISGSMVIDQLSQILLEPSICKQIQWSQWEIFIVQEKLVPFHDPRSQYGMFKGLILDPLVHEGNHLNLGPTVFAFNESLIGRDEGKIINELNSLLPEHLNLLIMDMDDERDSKLQEYDNHELETKLLLLKQGGTHEMLAGGLLVKNAENVFTVEMRTDGTNIQGMGGKNKWAYRQFTDKNSHFIGVSG
ncbi:hypothetical protein NCAS_0E03860 [Naumovozyma castellii]|uniref:6-phosphogluconolactonase n=1 Tax=Naumovozyma castellii TaxID=27288 RepID=G0VG37_NAUCA|nr:hypothetical protein NCAS_0E03860 [Naumovozyma castellii CBS 4309]CCC70456.1 hypothetical protein NCAS_0E03860 [Naumovozyma castellii CBS 4309]